MPHCVASICLTPYFSILLPSFSHLLRMLNCLLDKSSFISILCSKASSFQSRSLGQQPQCYCRVSKLISAPVPWTERRSNQSLLKEIDPEYSFGGLMLKLKLQSFGHLMRRTDSLEKTLMLGGIEGRRRRGCQRTDGWMSSLTQWT